MNKKHTVVALVALLLMPVYAHAQTSDRIVLLDNFGDFDKGDHLVIFGNLAQVVDDSFLILQIINPHGDICQIQQLTPLPNGAFLTEPIPLKGRICGISGEYEIRVFYGDYSKTANFSVNLSTKTDLSGSDLFDSATSVVSAKIDSVGEKTTLSPVYSERLESILSGEVSNTISDLEDLYVDLWMDVYIEDEFFNIDPTIRPLITSSLDSTAELVESGKLSFDIAGDIDRQIFSGLFYHAIGDKKTSFDQLNDAFVSTKNVDPVKAPTKSTVTYAELEDTLLNLMKKTGSVMSKQVKEEIAFIFSRGTAPLHADNLSELLDLLTKSRYLDVVSRKDDSLYRLVQSDWQTTRSTLLDKENIEELVDSKDKVDKLHKAAILLRDLDNVDRFISSDRDENSELANLILPSWDELSSDLELAVSVENILDSESEIKNMKQVIDISSRIAKAVEISQSAGVDSTLTESWELLLTQVDDANTMEDILLIVSEFDSSMTELREKRNPISLMIFEYQTMKQKAELQGDDKNLFMINNALRILDTAKQLEEGNPTINKIDRIEVLLTWVNEKAPTIKEELDSYSKDAYQVKAADILQRAKSVENLVELGLTKNRFLPGYLDFVDSMKEKVEQVRNMVIANELDAADAMVRDLFDEWEEVSNAYSDDPFGSDNGYSREELKRIEYREKLDSLSDMVSTFYNSDFAQHSSGYNTLVDDAYEYIDYGNFIDAESKINEISEYVSENLALQNSNIMYDISYDPESELWVLSGFVDKPVMDRREDLHATVYHMDGTTHSNLEFSDTKHGKFYTQWDAPADPGLYLVMLQYQNSKASQIVYVEDKVERSYSEADLDIVELAREFDELRTFGEEFGGEKYASDSRFAAVVDETKRALEDRDTDEVDEKLSDLQRLIERYLPVRSRSAVIEAQYVDNQLVISGAVQKTLEFREDLYVDVFDQRGDRMEEIALKDSSAGRFSESVVTALAPGTYVAQLEYHDLIVSDFFTVP